MERLPPGNIVVTPHARDRFRQYFGCRDSDRVIDLKISGAIRATDKIVPSSHGHGWRVRTTEPHAFRAVIEMAYNRRDIVVVTVMPGGRTRGDRVAQKERRADRQAPSMRALRIRAVMRNGIVARDPWSPSIDGIVASVVMRERLGEEEFTANAVRSADLAPVAGLPFEVVRSGDHWWYAVSSPVLVDMAGRQRRPFHRRFDDQMERYLDPDVRRINTSAGAYKNARLYDTRVICRAIEWHAIGDADRLKAVLATVYQIGARRGVGYGEVAGWEITEDGCHETARHNRPLPESYAQSLGLHGPVIPWGLVPPARIGLVDCVMPMEEAQHAA
jgi:CRISPR type IV-associated protein Csf3